MPKRKRPSYSSNKENFNDEYEDPSDSEYLPPTRSKRRRQRVTTNEDWGVVLRSERKFMAELRRDKSRNYEYERYERQREDRCLEYAERRPRVVRAPPPPPPPATTRREIDWTFPDRGFFEMGFTLSDLNTLFRWDTDEEYIPTEMDHVRHSLQSIIDIIEQCEWTLWSIIDGVVRPPTIDVNSMSKTGKCDTQLSESKDDDDLSKINMDDLFSPW